MEEFYFFFLIYNFENLTVSDIAEETQHFSVSGLDCVRCHKYF